MVLFAGICVDRVKEDVGVDVLFVYMDADDRLVAGQVLLRKLPRDLQRQLRGDLSGLKGLNEVVILYAALLAHGPLGLQYLPALMARVTVETGCKDLLLGLIPVEHIADAHVQAALPGQDLGDGHYFFATSYMSS